MMKRGILGLVALGVGCASFCSCEKIEEVPPLNESTNNKVYRIPDPENMSASDIAAFNTIRDEYNAAVNR